MTTVTFTGNTPEELKRDILNFANEFLSFDKVDRQPELPIQTPPPVPAIVKEEPKKVGKKHSKVEEVVAAMPTEVVAAVADTGNEPTKESVLKAMKDLNAAKGIVPVQKILKDFGAARATDVKQNDWAKFIQTCNEAAL
jgi:hypothetical protein